MATLTIPPGISILAYAGTTALPLTGSSKPSWFTAANFNGIYKQSTNRQSFIACSPASSFPAFSTLEASATGAVPNAYIFNLKQQIVVDSGLFTPVSSSSAPVPATIDLDGTTVVPGETVFDASDQAVSFTSASSLTAAFSQGTGTVQVSIDSGATWTALSTTAYPLAANTSFIARVQHTAGTAFYATITATF